MSKTEAGLLSALQWTSYSVSRAEKEPLLHFITQALEMRQCRVIHASNSGRAPFYIVFETPAGERHGLLAYAFFANSKVIKNRPEDEHRFQIKYGGDLKAVLDVAVDTYGVVTTIFLGIDHVRGIFVAADPLMNTPSPMSRSIEFKSRHVEQIHDEGWVAWERDRKPPKTKDRRAHQLAMNVRTEVLVGAKQERLLDLIILEIIAQGFDPGERHLVADKLKANLSPEVKSVRQHGLLKELDILPEALFDLIEGANRLKMAVRGWVAETHLEDTLRTVPGVSECRRIEAEGKPDISLRWKGSRPILLECKNTLREKYADGRYKIDFQRTRASKGDPCSRYYSPNDFQILAACLHAVTERWEFSYALTLELPPHDKCKGQIKNMIAVSEPLFTHEVEIALDRCVGQVG